MKKKRYIKPVVSVMEMETTAILAGSVIQKETSEGGLAKGFPRDI